MSENKTTRKVWNRERTYALLRYGRKESGPWDCYKSASPEWNEGDIPDDKDLELVLAAPEMFELLEHLLDPGEYHNCDEIEKRIQEIIKRVKGDQ